MTKKQEIRKKLNEMGIYSIEDFIDALIVLSGKNPYPHPKMRSETATQEKKPLTEQENTFALEVKVKGILRRLGVPINLIGYQYLVDGIILGVTDRESMKNKQKVFYPKIAEKNGTTFSRVEGSIWTAIDTTCKKGNQQELEKLFGKGVDYRKKKIPNGKFIGTIVEYLSMGEE